MAERFYGPTRIVLSGNREAAANLVPLGTKFLGILRDRIGFQNPGRWRRQLPDGSFIEVINTGFNLAPTILISSPPVISEEALEEFVGGIVCEPRVSQDTDISDPQNPFPTYITWGAPFEDMSGNPINPPMGTQFGTNPEVVITKNLKTNIYEVDHQRDAKVGNIDWVYNPTSDSPRYLSWKGPFGRSVGVGWYDPAISLTNNFLLEPIEDYVSADITPSGGKTIRFYHRWGNNIYMDGVQLVSAPVPVISAAIANLDDGTGNKKDYLVVIGFGGASVLQDVLYTAELSGVVSGSPSWNNLGSIGWSYNTKTRPRDIPHFFDPTGTKAIQTFFYPTQSGGNATYATLRLEMLSYNTWTTSHTEYTDSVYFERLPAFVDDKPGRIYHIYGGLNQSTAYVPISSDYNQTTGLETHLEMETILTGTCDAGPPYQATQNLQINLRFPNKTYTLLNEFGSGGVAKDVEIWFRGFVLDCRYNRFVYHKSSYIWDRPGGIITNTMEIYDNDTNLFQTQNTQGTSSMTGSSLPGCISSLPHLEPINLNVGELYLVLTGADGRPSQVIPSTFRGGPWTSFYTANVKGDTLISFWNKPLNQLGGADPLYTFNFIGSETILNNTNKDSLSTLTSLITQSEYADERRPTHSNPGVF